VTGRLRQQYAGLSLVRAVNEQVVLETVLHEGAVSRARIARLTGLSKPTVSSVVQDLEACGLVREQGQLSGNVGRPSTLYEVNPRAGYVLGVDVGGSKIRAGIADLYGEVVAEVTDRTAKTSGQALVRQIVRLFGKLVTRSKLDRNLVRAAGVGVPGIFDPAADHVFYAPNLPVLEELAITDALVRALGLPVLIDNDVNLAAVGERWRGLAGDQDHFVAISIGTGIGMGIVLGGEIYRGARGAAGEIDFLPMGADPFDPHGTHGPLEAAVTGPALLDRLRARVESGAETSVANDDEVQGVFDGADRGDPVAVELVEEEARIVALAIAAVAAVLDPRLVVLGGGIGSNPVLLEPVRRHVARIFPRRLDVRTSALGDRAAFLGAVAVGLRAARQSLLAEVATGR
jgi:predicted NBD/HSP70 family sugar kinase